MYHAHCQVYAIHHYSPVQLSVFIKFMCFNHLTCEIKIKLLLKGYKNSEVQLQQ